MVVEAAAAVAVAVAEGGAVASASPLSMSPGPISPLSVSPMSVSDEPVVEHTRLDNGITVVTEHVPGMRSVAVGCWIGVGSRDEPAQRAGASHFLEHLLFKGSARRDARQIAEAVDRVGGDFNAYTTKEYTAFYCRVPADSQQMAAELVTEVVAAPTFTAEHVEGERQVILEELAMSEDTPDDLVHSKLDEALFPEHPLGREVLGTIDSIEAMTVEDIRAFHAEWYRPTNLVVAAAGGVDHASLVAQVVATFGGHSGARPIRSRPELGPAGDVVVRKPTEQVQVALGWRGIAQDDADRFALALANQIIGGGLSSRLFQEIREKRSLAYAVYSGSSAYVDSGAFVVYAGCSPKRLGELLAVLDGELSALIAEGVTDQELDVARGGFEGATVLGLEDSGSRMSRLGSVQTIRGTVISVDEYLAAIDAVTVDDVNRVIRRVLSPPPTRSVVGPVKQLPDRRQQT